MLLFYLKCLIFISTSEKSNVIFKRFFQRLLWSLFLCNSGWVYFLSLRDFKWSLFFGIIPIGYLFKTVNLLRSGLQYLCTRDLRMWSLLSERESNRLDYLRKHVILLPDLLLQTENILILIVLSVSDYLLHDLFLLLQHIHYFLLFLCWLL